MWKSVLAVSSGAALGAILRWQLGIWLGTASNLFSWGTLAANLTGGFIMGVAMAVFACMPGLSPEMQLFVKTGFLGALTTFSTFSAEVFGILQSGRCGLAALLAVGHLFGTLTALWGGMALAASVRSWLVQTF